MRFLSCLPMLLLVFALSAQNDCHITNLSATLIGPDPVTCQYSVSLTFEHTGTTNQFIVRGNGIVYDTLPYGTTPVVLGPFTAGAMATTREFVVRDFVFGECQASTDLSIPACSPQSCNIQQQLVAEAGDCNADSTYHLFLNFTPPSLGADSFTVSANGQSFGRYAVSQLPLQIPNFPWNGGAFDVVQVCLDATATAAACCGELEFHVPTCFPYAPCELSQLHITAGACTSDSTFSAVLDFQVATPAVADSFELWASGHYLGAFGINQLPLTIPNFPWNGQIFSNVKVCTGNDVGCCREKQFLAPSCLPFGPCNITNISAITGPCNGDDTYKLTVNFQGTNPGNGNFTLSANSQVIGIYPLTALPLTIPNFPASGNAFDILKICINDVPGTVICCRDQDVHAPNCNPVDSCGIHELSLQTGECTGDSTYQVTVNFQVTGTTSTIFRLVANGLILGGYSLSQLPLTISNFRWNGGSNDVIQVCMLNSNSSNTCCATLEFPVPACLQTACEIHDLTVQTGECHGDSAYVLLVNFQVTGSTTNNFQVYANGQLFGTYTLSQLPLSIPNFPWNGGNNDVIRVCMGDNAAGNACCKTLEFAVPPCLQTACEIHELTVQTGECHGDSAYVLLVNFQVTGSTTNNFQVYANGQLFGTYTLSQLPLSIPNFPWNGGNNDVIRVCMGNSATGNNCCKTLEFAVPPCLQTACEIHELTVQTGECHGDSAYVLLVNFQVTGSTTNSFQVYANGQLFGTYTLSQLPLSIPNFPWNGGNNDVIRVCMGDNAAGNACCKTLEFAVPPCLQTACEIHELTVQTGECHGDSAYVLLVNFQVTGSTTNSFQVFANGQLFGTYTLSQLPLSIPNFPWNGGNNDVIKVCMGNSATGNTCCKTLEFAVPPCLQTACEIHELTVQTGECHGDSAYVLLVNFQVTGSTTNSFQVFANGQLFGTYTLSQLPLSIPNFPWNGGNNDVIRVCMGNSATGNTCCKTLEFAVPPCLQTACEIHDLTAQTGECHGDSAYFLLVNFQVTGSTTNSFQVFANGQLFGTYTLSQLPLSIPNFPWNGGNNDVIRVCMGNSATGNTCCKTLEFAVPDCLQGSPCEIFDVVVDPGECHPNSNTYNLVLNFQVQNPGNASFEVWAGNGQYLGIFPLSALPLTIPNFPWGGGAADHIKICINDHPDCCRTKEFPAPSCFGNDCEVNNLTVQTGECQGDSTYQILLNFQVTNPPVNTFSVYANGHFFGSFQLNQLPLTIPHFPWNGGNNDVIKVCFGTAGALNCCATLEFAVPDCLMDACQISDAHVLATPCLCGQFFALVSFDHENGAPGGFDIVGNGHNYGTFPYNTPQPIILGPLVGDNTTMYEFNVHDHLHPDCHDAVQLGKVECPTLATTTPTTDATLLLSPNPVNNWLNATALLSGGARMGQSTVQVFYADGRLVMTQSVEDGSSFRLDVSTLPAGVYRLAVRSDRGSLEGSFSKM